MSVLKELCISKGVDPSDWSADNRREAVVELFERDERETLPMWIADCLSEGIAFEPKERHALISALKHDSPAMRHAAIGIIVERALLNFPLGTLQQICEENEGDWLAEDHRAALRDEADSLNDARRV